MTGQGGKAMMTLPAFVALRSILCRSGDTELLAKARACSFPLSIAHRRPAWDCAIWCAFSSGVRVSGRGGLAGSGRTTDQPHQSLVTGS